MIFTSKKNVFILTFITIILVYCQLSFGADIINNAQAYKDGPNINTMHKIGVTGDSYGGLLSDMLGEKYNMDLSGYCKAGATIIENKDLTIECIHNKYKYIVLSIGVNDHVAQTDIDAFLNQINFFAELAKKYKKQLILHTYMTYPSSNIYIPFHTCEEYDAALRIIDSLYDCVWYIDMHDANSSIYHQEDQIHYNRAFYQLLIDRLIATLDIIKSTNET